MLHARKLVLVALLAIAGCGGGVGGGIAGVPTPTPIQSAGPAIASGQVVDAQSRAGIGGVAVAFSAAGAAIAPKVAATTAPDGRFTATSSALGPQILVLVPSARAQYPFLHATVTLAVGPNQLGALRLSLTGADDRMWLARVNLDRAQFAAAALVLDEFALEAARQHGGDMAKNAYLAHDDLHGNTPQQRFAALGGIGAVGENVGDGLPASTWQGYESISMAEQANCPQPPTYATCPFSENTGHFLNIINPSAVWVGFDIASGTLPNSAQPGNYFDQEFIAYP